MLQTLTLVKQFKPLQTKCSTVQNSSHCDGIFFFFYLVAIAGTLDYSCPPSITRNIEQEEKLAW